MKFFTKSIIRFIWVFTITTVVFRATLSYFLAEREFSIAWVSAFLYGMTAFAEGWFCGKRDSDELELYDIGIRFHLSTYIIWGAVSGIWFLGGFHSVHEHISSVHYTLLFWGAGLLLHGIIFFILKKKRTIKGIDKSDIFE